MRIAFRLPTFFVALIGLTALAAVKIAWTPRAHRLVERARRQRFVCRAVCRLLGVRVTVRDSWPVDDVYLVVCNHVGILDAFALAAVLPVAFAAKAEMGRWPAIGWVCRVGGVILVSRDRAMSTDQFVRDVHDRMKSGVSVLVFPEGTIGPPDTLLPFRTGAFEAVAGSDELAILPLYLAVQRDARSGVGPETVRWDPTDSMMRHALKILGAPRISLQVRVGRPFAAAGMDRKALAVVGREAVAELGQIDLTDAR